MINEYVSYDWVILKTQTDFSSCMFLFSVHENGSLTQRSHWLKPLRQYKEFE